MWKKLFGVFAVLLILFGAIAVVYYVGFSQKSFYVGVTYCGSSVQEAKELIDKVKDYTNLFVLQSGTLASVDDMTEIGNYAVASKLNFVVYASNAVFQGGLDKINEWANAAKEMWGEAFIGIYYNDEPGGNMLDTAYFFLETNTGRSMYKNYRGGVSTNINDTNVVYDPNGEITTSIVYSIIYEPNGTITTRDRNFFQGTAENGTKYTFKIPSYENFLNALPFKNYDDADEAYINGGEKDPLQSSDETNSAQIPYGVNSVIVNGVSMDKNYDGGISISTVGGRVTYYPNGEITTSISCGTVYDPNGTITTSHFNYFLQDTAENSTEYTFQIPSYEELFNANPIKSYDDAAEAFINGGKKTLQNINKTQLNEKEIVVFTADYGLYWWDYQIGYDCILASVGWNNSITQEIGLARGAASLQNKQWGTILTWTYTHPPYLTNGEDLFEQMKTSYETGAQYVIIFNYSKDPTNSNTLQDEHFQALERFWKDVVKNPLVRHGGIKAEAALVLPQNYGWGMRNPDDNIWGLWSADNNSQEIWSQIQSKIDQHGLKLDIVFEDPDYTVAGKYSNIYYWNKE
jgi:hypothetical protein